MNNYLIWDKEDVLPDELFYYQDFNLIDFLKSKKSFLTNYKISGILYSDWLMSVCKENNINAKIIICSLQKEQGLVTITSTPPEKLLKRCLGFGMTDSGDLQKYYGFENQHISAISWFNKKFSLAKNLVKENKGIVVDGGLLKLFPKNAFTYVLYLYTPWTGGPDSDFFKNKRQIGGVYLFWKLWLQYWKEDLKIPRKEMV